MLSVDNATLTFHAVTMSDSGNYSCMASNAVSDVISEGFSLAVLCEYLKRCKLERGGLANYIGETKKTLAPMCAFFSVSMSDLRECLLV